MRSVPDLSGKSDGNRVQEEESGRLYPWAVKPEPVQEQEKSGLNHSEFEIEMKSDCIDFCYILCYYFNDDRLLVLEHCKRGWRRRDESKVIGADMGKTDRHYKKDAQDWRRR